MNPTQIRNFILGNNIIWYLLYYDELVQHPDYHLSLLHQADRPFYNAVHALSHIDPALLNEIEQYYERSHLSPVFFTDPGNVAWLKPFLQQKGYHEIQSERENWWVKTLNEKITLPHDNTADIEKINSQDIKQLNDFLNIDQITNQLPVHLIDKLRTHIQQRNVPGAFNTLWIGRVKHVSAFIGSVGIVGENAYLAEGGTLASYRGMGLHTQMTLARLNYAYDQGCRRAVLTCTEEALSNLTARKLGFQLLCTRECYGKNTV